MEWKPSNAMNNRSRSSFIRLSQWLFAFFTLSPVLPLLWQLSGRKSWLHIGIDISYVHNTCPEVQRHIFRQIILFSYLLHFLYFPQILASVNTHLCLEEIHIWLKMTWLKSTHYFFLSHLNLIKLWDYKMHNMHTSLVIVFI